MRNNRTERIMQGWRMRVQTRIMAYGALLAFPAVVQTLSRTVQHPGEWYSAIALIIMYIGFIGLAFQRRIRVQIRGWLFVLLVYLVGVVAMARGGLWGDGRIYLVLLPMFGMLLIDIRAGKLLVVVSILTYAVFGYLNHIGLLERWLITTETPLPTEIWVYDGLIYAALMIIVIVMLVDFFTLLMQTLASEHEYAQELRKTHQLLDQANRELEENVLQRTAELAEANQRLRQLVNHDPLTGLPNRTLFYDRLLHAIARSKRTKKKLAILFIDLDNFKVINDSLGHTSGDALLIKVATRLEKNMRESDTVARLSGDEYAIILENLTKPEDVVESAKRMLEALDEPFHLDDNTASLSASIGISIYPDDAEDPDELIRYADTAMYRVKHTTKNNFEFYMLKQHNETS